MATTDPATAAAKEYADAREAQRCRLSVLANLDNEGRGNKMVYGLMGLHPDETNEDQQRFADRTRQQIILALAESETMVATEEVCRILDQTHGGYPTAQMFMSDIPAPAGLVYFSEPIADPLPSEVQYAMRAISWHVAEVANEIEDADYHVVDFDPTGRYAVTIIGYTDTRHMPGYVEVGPSNLPRMYPITSVVWETDVPDGGDFVGDEGPEGARARLDRVPYVKALMAYWAIVRQRLVVDQEVVVKGSAKELDVTRRAERRHPDMNSTIRVVRMRPRRKKYVYEGDHGFNRPDWANSWMVRSHWRMQPYPATGERKPKLILSYPKGPDDRPMKGTDRVWLPPLPLKKDR